MTTRPGNAALGLHQNHRTKRLCNLVRILRTDGTEATFSDHDRELSFEGRSYIPATFTAMSAERREVALRTPDQELHGVIDGTNMLLPDLMGQRYRGAQVWHVVTDWQYPWLVIARNYKTIRGVRWDGLRFVAMLDGIAQILERPAGGRFGGIASYECPYVLGGTYCGKDISADVQTGARVATVNDSRLEVEISAASWDGSFSDDYFRDGEVEWLWGPPNFNGTTTAPNTTSTVLTQTGAGLTPDAHIGETVRILSGIGGRVLAYATVTDNDADTVTYEETDSMSGYSSGQNWDVVPDAANKGVISPIVRYVESSRQIELFYPTPYDIEQFDSGIVRPGCNGLFSTCDTKFSNSLNFGGNHLQPQPGDMLEVAR